MFRSYVTIQIALLGESALTDGTDEFRLHAALVLLVSPERREKRVHAITPYAHVLLLRLPVALVLGLSLVRLPTLVALECLMPQQRGFQSERPAAIVAEILTGTSSAADQAVLVRGHRTKAPSVHRDSRRRR